jgi:hypothetical protein
MSETSSTAGDDDPSATSTGMPEPYCGDGQVDRELDEACDGDDWAIASCMVLGYVGGTLACEDCELDTSRCVGEVPCGNGTLDDGEECDTTEFGGETCASQRMDDDFRGDLHCNSGTCTIDDTLCCKGGGADCIPALANECCSGTCGLDLKCT